MSASAAYISLFIVEEFANISPNVVRSLIRSILILSLYSLLLLFFLQFGHVALKIAFMNGKMIFGWQLQESVTFFLFSIRFSSYVSYPASFLFLFSLESFYWFKLTEFD